MLIEEAIYISRITESAFTYNDLCDMDWGLYETVVNKARQIKEADESRAEGNRNK